MDVSRIGRVVKPEGIKGFIKLDIEEEYQKSLKNASFLFLYLDGLPIPFQITELKTDKNVLVRLEEVDSPEEAMKFVNISVGLHKKDLIHVKKSIVKDHNDWVGFLIYNKETLVGAIEEISLFPGQLMAIVKNEKGNPIHIPLIENWIELLDTKNKKITMNLPEGLLEIS